MVEQLSVFLANKPGKIAAITRALAEKNIDIRALSIADTTDFGVLRMLVDNISLAKEVLTKLNCVVRATEVTVVAVPDVPGGLARIMELLAHAEIDIEYMYSIIDSTKGKAYTVFRVTDEEKLLELLEENGIAAVTGEELGIS